MANDDGIAEAGDHGGAIFQRFPGSHVRAGRRHVFHPDRMGAEGDGGDLEADAGAGAGLKKQQGYRLTAKAQRCRNPDLVGFGELAEVVDGIRVQRPGAQQVLELSGAGLAGEIGRGLPGELASGLERRIRHLLHNTRFHSPQY
jgi:hypothetical protein